MGPCFIPRTRQHPGETHTSPSSTHLRRAAVRFRASLVRREHPLCHSGRETESQSNWAASPQKPAIAWERIQESWPLPHTTSP